MNCSRCVHPIEEHYPNFKDGKPLTFYCGHGSTRMTSGGLAFGDDSCSCLRPEREIQWRQDGSRFYAVAERA